MILPSALMNSLRMLQVSRLRQAPNRATVSEPRPAASDAMRCTAMQPVNDGNDFLCSRSEHQAKASANCSKLQARPSILCPEDPEANKVNECKLLIDGGYKKPSKAQRMLCGPKTARIRVLKSCRGHCWSKQGCGTSPHWIASLPSPRTDFRQTVGEKFGRTAAHPSSKRVRVRANECKGLRCAAWDVKSSHLYTGPSSHLSTIVSTFSPAKSLPRFSIPWALHVPSEAWAMFSQRSACIYSHHIAKRVKWSHMARNPARHSSQPGAILCNVV